MRKPWRLSSARHSGVDIKEAVDIHFRDIGHDPENLSVVYENAQARERTQIIMDIANADNSLVIGTGDLSELALGWATYNGDHMSNYGVNGGVPKTLVRHVVGYYADLCESEGKTALAKVLRDVLDTPVSPELLPAKDGEIAQKTEDIVGPYCTISSAGVRLPTRFTGKHGRHLREDLTMKLSRSGSTSSSAGSTASSSREAHCPTAPEWDRWHCPPEARGSCPPTPAAGK